METDSDVPSDASDSGPYGQAALQVAWDKLYRARSILEAEQAYLRDDRIAIQGEVDALEARDRALAARELRVREVELRAALDREEEQDKRNSRSPLAKLTRAPFDIARSVFGHKK